MVAAGVLVCLAAATATDGYLVPALVREAAGFIAGPLHAIALPARLPIVLAELAAMAVAYALAVALAPRLPLAAIVVPVVILHVVCTLAPPLLSTDVFNYVDLGRLGRIYHLDPYVSPPATEKHDVVFPFLHWRHAVDVYGPLFTLGAQAIGRLPVAAAMWTYKVVGALASLGCTALVGWLAHRGGRSAARAVAVFGLNPLLVVYTVGGAHNDLLMLVVLLGGVALVMADRAVPGGALMVAAAAVKLSAGLAAPFLLAHRGGRLRLLAGLVGGAAAVVALAVTSFPDHAAGMVTGLQHQQTLVDISSVPREIALVLHLPTVTPAETRWLHVALAVWLAIWLVYTLRGGDPLRAIGWAFLGVVVASSWILPWYLIWPLAFAAAAGDGRLWAATCALGVSYVAGHVPL